MLIAGLAPGTWLRTDLPDERLNRLAFTRVEHAAPSSWPRGLSIEGVWELRSPDPFFGGYSALLPLAEGRFRAFSDRGDSLSFAPPGRATARPEFTWIEPDPRFADEFQDIESVTADAERGRYWLGYEQFHAVRRFTPDQPEGRLVTPAQMAGLSRNSGAEAIARLPDGRFLLLPERGGWGLLFAGDPLEHPRGMKFAIDYPGEGFRPTDAAVLPDGRVLVLMRQVNLALPPFSSLIAIGDPQDISAASAWKLDILARLDGALPPENYEALAMTRDGDTVAFWIMSDDNLGTFQRTLLARLRWQP